VQVLLIIIILLSEQVRNVKTLFSLWLSVERFCLQEVGFMNVRMMMYQTQKLNYFSNFQLLYSTRAWWFFH